MSSNLRKKTSLITFNHDQITKIFQRPFFTENKASFRSWKPGIFSVSNLYSSDSNGVNNGNRTHDLQGHNLAL